MTALLASGNPFQIVVLPVLLVIAMIAGVCLFVGLFVISVVTVVLLANLPRRKMGQSGDDPSPLQE
jgi:hypothetical protein